MSNRASEKELIQVLRQGVHDPKAEALYVVRENDCPKKLQVFEPQRSNTVTAVNHNRMGPCDVVHICPHKHCILWCSAGRHGQAKVCAGRLQAYRAAMQEVKALDDVQGNGGTLLIPL